jgi:hypothetical protein
MESQLRFDKTCRSDGKAGVLSGECSFDVPGSAASWWPRADPLGGDAVTAASAAMQSHDERVDEYRGLVLQTLMGAVSQGADTGEQSLGGDVVSRLEISKDGNNGSDQPAGRLRGQ